MAKFDFDKPVASFSWYLQNGSADDKRGNRLHVGTGQNAQIYFDPESGEFIGKLKYVDDYIDLADGAKQHFELPRTAREYKPSDFSPKFPISNVKFEVDESVKDFIHVLPRGLFFYQNEFYDAVFGDKTDYPESLKDFLFTRTGDIETAGEFYGAIEKWPQSVYGTLVEKCNVENRPIPEYENDRVLPLDPKELLPDDISKVEINDGMMAFLKTYRFNVSDEHTGGPIRQEVYDFDFKDADFYSALYGDVGNWPPAVLRGIVDRFAETGTHGPEFKSEYSLPTGYHEKLFDALKSYFKCTGEDYTTIDETIYMEYLGGADVDGYSLKFSPEALVSAVESGSRSLEGELVPLIDYELIGGGKTYEYLPCGCQVDIPMNDSMVAASQLLRNLQNAGVDISKLPNLSCDECSQLAAKVIPYTENKAQSAPDRTLGHKHEVNRDVAQRMQTERTTVNQIREEDTVGE